MPKNIWATPAGQATLAFLRVFVAAVLGAWLQAGMTLRGLTWDLAVTWVEVGLSAGVALVLANYLGPWETRYGRNKVSDAKP